MLAIEHLQAIHEDSNIQTGENTRRESTQRTGRMIQRRVLNDRSHPCHKSTECREFKMPLCISFIDYEKAFDLVQTQAILSSLKDQGIEYAYIQLMKDIYTDSSVTVHLHKGSDKINIKRVVQQGGYHLTQTIHINTRKYLQKTELREQRPENRRRIS